MRLLTVYVLQVEKVWSGRLHRSLYWCTLLVVCHMRCEAWRRTNWKVVKERTLHMCVCVCVCLGILLPLLSSCGCVCWFNESHSLSCEHIHKKTHTHVNKRIYTYRRTQNDNDKNMHLYMRTHTHSSTHTHNHSRILRAYHAEPLDLLEVLFHLFMRERLFPSFRGICRDKTVCLCLCV